MNEILQVLHMPSNHALQRSVTAFRERSQARGPLSRLRCAGQARTGPLNADVRHLGSEFKCT